MTTETKQLDWKTEQRRIKELVPLERNPFGKINREKRKRLENKITRLGVFEIPTIDLNNDLLTFNKRAHILMALGRGEEIIDVRVPTRALTSDERREVILASNVHEGEWDGLVLEEDFSDINLEEMGVDLRGLDLDFNPVVELSMLEPEIGDHPKLVDIEETDLFELIGNGLHHRLMCGDSTNPKHVEKLMDGKLADMVFTDPPYGVNVKGGKGKGNTIAGDLTQTAIPFSFELCIKYTKDKARFYFCGGEGNISLYFKLCERFLAKAPKILIWVKNGFVMKPTGYHNQYELIFYTYKDGGGGTEHWYSGRKEDEASDVWQVKRDASSTYQHPTQKPIELPSRAIRNSSQEGNLVYEPFSGSGSTMGACDQLKRDCYAMELDPRYCDVTINRMLKLNPGLKVLRNGSPYQPQE
jgi:DNA modification methylase